ncbi:MAG: Ca-activated chloride channel family protein, partial [Verrucomicrobiaceae bacterium]|nr:Ca-activated chloride channel family protein [Verrucomicrobiaceae bacterium]
MTFVHPEYFHFLWLLPLLLLLRVWTGRTSGRAAESFVAARLRALLVAGASPGRAWGIFILQLLALAGFIGALTQPYYGVEKNEIPQTGKDVIVAIDTSRSMLADDVKPNRLMRAKLAAQDILLTLQGNRVGLVAFAGRGYLQAPLTTDHEAVIESIQILDTNTIPRGGTTISDAIREALDAFDKSKARNHGLILFSDGGDEDTDLDSMLQKAREKKVLILTVGVGTDAGSLIPDPDPEKSGDFVRDPATGNPVHTRLEEATLQRIAKETGGHYMKLGSQSLSAGVVANILSTLEAMESGNREELKPIDRFYWPLSTGMLALMLALLMRPSASLRRFSPAVAALMLLCGMPVVSKGAIFNSDKSTADEAREAYKNREFPRARDLYARLLSEEQPPEVRDNLSYSLGAACQQLKEHDRAIESFSQSLESHDPAMQRRSHQGLGTTLYDLGAKSLQQQQPEVTQKAWEDSLRHFEAADKLHSDTSTAKNIEFVRKQLVELKKQMEQQKKQQKQKGKKGQEG